MRVGEIAIWSLCAPLLAFLLVRGAAPSWLRWITFIAIVGCFVQIAVEGARWTMIPTYIAVLGLCWATSGFSGECPLRLMAMCGFGLLLASAAMCSVLPVFSLPMPTGPHAVGTATLHLIDESRRETQAGAAGPYRELMTQLWYPTDDDGPRAYYRQRNEVTWLKQHLSLAKTNSVTGARAAAKPARFPVILFSPSWTGRRSQNTVQAEELASHGFVVIGIDHPFGTDQTVFPDGRQARTTLGEPIDFTSDESLGVTVKTAEEQLQIRAADVRFVLDEIERWSRCEPAGLLTGRIDMSRVGVFGHSFGGAVAAEICSTDPRVRAGANFDGFVLGESLISGFRKPFLILETATPCPTESEIAAAHGAARRHLAFIAANTHAIRSGLAYAGGYWASVRGTSHMNFCDSPLYTPIKSLSHAGPIARERAFAIINTALVDFFRAELNTNGDGGLAALPQRFHEVELERIAASAP